MNPVPGPAATPPHVHHHNPAGSPATNAAHVGEALQPADYQNPALAPHLQTELPAQMVFVNGDPEAAPAAPQPPAPSPVKTQDEVAHAAADSVYAALTTKPDTLWAVILYLIKLAFLASRIDPRVVRVALPFNAGQVMAGGMASIKTVQADKKAETTLAIDVNQLGVSMGQVILCDQALEVLEPMYRVAEANKTVALSQVAETVAKGVKVGNSVIASDAKLSWAMGPALAIRNDPSDAAVASRAERERVTERLKTELAPAAGGDGAAPPAGPTVTVTSPGLPVVTSPGAAAPASPKTVHRRGKTSAK